jgi:hypothetical protein
MARGVDPKVMAEERAKRAVAEVRAHRGMHLPAWLLWAALALIAAAELAVARGLTPPAPIGADASAAEFSAERARRVLERVVGDGAPRPTGSAANARARERIVEELRAIGLASTLETGTVCGRSGVCARVNNVVAEIAGREAGRGVLLAAHYDSVPAGPGAADDASGVAVMLEVARVLRGAAPRCKVVLLFSDGEELGLLGAELFVRESRHFAEVSAVVNLEARGTSGPSLMFETSPANAPLIDAFAATAVRPVTSSALYEVYRRMPNDSDFSVLKAHGLRGYNFAFIGGVPHYHTSRDEPKQLSLSSLQHHGDNALSALRALAETPGVTRAGGDAVFFDVAGWRLVSWRTGRSPWLVAAAAFGLLLGLSVSVLRGSIRGGALLSALLLVPGALALCAFAAFGLEVVLRLLGGLPAPWIAHPVPTAAACVVIAVASLALVASPFGPEGAPALWGGCFVWLAGGAALLVWRVPGASFLLLLPALAAGLSGAIWLTFGRGLLLAGVFAALLPIAATALTWLPVLNLLYTAVGFVSLPAFALAFAVPLLTLAPLLASLKSSWLRPIPLTAPVLVVASAALALFLPKSSHGVPQWSSLAFHQDADSGSARYMADVSFGPLPPALKTTGLPWTEADPRPWRGSWRGQAMAAPAPVLELPPPEFAVTSSENTATGRIVRGILRSARRAPLVELELPSPIGLRVRGVAASARYVPPSHVYSFVVDDPNGVELTLELGKTPLPALLVDHSFELPEKARSVAARRTPNEVPFHFGDVTVVSRGTSL